MLAGGNGRLRAYWRKHGLLTASFEDKYTSPAMARYREGLKRAVDAQLANPSLLPSIMVPDETSGKPVPASSASDGDFFTEQAVGDIKKGTVPAASPSPRLREFSPPSDVDLQSRIIGFGSDPFYVPAPASPLNFGTDEQAVTSGCLTSLQSCVLLLRSLSEDVPHRPLGDPSFGEPAALPPRLASAAAVRIPQPPRRKAGHGLRGPQSSSAPSQHSTLVSPCLSCSPPGSVTPATEELRERRVPLKADKDDGL